MSTLELEINNDEAHSVEEYFRQASITANLGLLKSIPDYPGTTVAVPEFELPFLATTHEFRPSEC